MNASQPRTATTPHRFFNDKRVRVQLSPLSLHRSNRDKITFLLQALLNPTGCILRRPWCVVRFLVVYLFYISRRGKPE